VEIPYKNSGAEPKMGSYHINRQEQDIGFLLDKWPAIIMQYKNQCLRDAVDDSLNSQPHISEFLVSSKLQI
jgi:hypothetical protein